MNEYEQEVITQLNDSAAKAVKGSEYGPDEHVFGIAAQIIEEKDKLIAELEESVNDRMTAQVNQAIRITTMQRQIAGLGEGITAVRCLVDESLGVAGLHLNGDLAEWQSLMEGGFFENWLIKFNKAEDLLTNNKDKEVSDE